MLNYSLNTQQQFMDWIRHFRFNWRWKRQRRYCRRIWLHIKRGETYELGNFHNFASSLFSPIWFVLKIEADERRLGRKFENVEQQAKIDSARCEIGREGKLKMVNCEKGAKSRSRRAQLNFHHIQQNRFQIESILLSILCQLMLITMKIMIRKKNGINWLVIICKNIWRIYDFSWLLEKVLIL